MNRPLRTLVVVSLFSVTAVAGTAQRAAAQNHYPVLQVEPTMNNPPIPNGNPFRDACLDPGSWPTGWDRSDFFGNAHQFMATLSDGELAQCFANVHRSGKQLMIAAGALKPQCNTAQNCWNQDLGNLWCFRDLGEAPDYVGSMNL